MGADRKAFLLSDMVNHLRLKVSGVDKIQLVWVDDNKEVLISEVTIPKGHDPLQRRF